MEFSIFNTQYKRNANIINLFRLAKDAPAICHTTTHKIVGAARGDVTPRSRHTTDKSFEPEGVWEKLFAKFQLFFLNFVYNIRMNMKLQGIKKSQSFVNRG